MFITCKITIPNSVTEIAKGVFYQCSSLINITIPNSVIKIDENAFPPNCKIISEDGNDFIQYL